MAQRQESDYINLRNFHNFIKSQLITNSARRIPDKFKKSLVDISVGRGGDLFKWNNARINYVLGFDPDAESVEEAKMRYNNIKAKSNFRTKVDLEVATITDEKFAPDFIKPSTKFNIVSCQFSLHYFFKTQQMFDFAMYRIAQMLRPGGFFIGTTLDGDKINKLLSENPMIENEHYTIEKKYEEYLPFGSQYNFYLKDKDHTGNYFTKVSEEYLVSKEILTQACAHFGLKLVQMKDFSEWYKTYSRKGLKDYERSVSFLYFSFVFQKPLPKRGPVHRPIPVKK